MSLSHTRSQMIGWTIWMVASIFYAYQYLLRVIPNILLDDILHRFHLDASQFGQFSGIYYIGYSLMHLPIGIFLDRFGSRKVMSLCILFSVFGFLSLLMQGHWIYPILGRLFVGMGSSAAILGVFKVIRIAFREEKFARMLSFSATIGLLGAIYGGAPVKLLRESLGYESFIQVVAIGGVLLALFSYLLIPSSEKTQSTSVLSDLKEVLSNRKVLSVCALAGLMVGPLEGFADVWGSSFLKHVYAFDGVISSSLPSMIFIGMCFGAPCLSFIADKTKSYLGTIIGSAIVMALVFFLLCAGGFSPLSISIGFSAVGVCCAYQILAIFYVTTCVRDHLVSLTTALANMIIMIFGYAFHSAMGWLISSSGGPENASALIQGVLVIPFALCIAAIGFGLVKRKEKLMNLSVRKTVTSDHS